MQDRHSRLSSSIRALFYKSFSIFRFEPYLDMLKVNKYRELISRLRLSFHRLAIETGRWAKPTSKPINKRKCLHCNTLEDEYHFIIECTLYSDIRNMYLNRYYTVNPYMYKFIQLVNSDKKRELMTLGIFI